MRSVVVMTILSIASFALIACGEEGSSDGATRTLTVPSTAPSGLTIVSVRFDGGELYAELASTPKDRALGLGNRDLLDLNSGMLFDLGTSRVPTFSMRGMRIPLDMIWIDERRTIVEITADIPPEPGVPSAQLKPYSPDQPVRYVLEVNAGSAARLGLSPGDALEFELAVE